MMMMMIKGEDDNGGFQCIPGFQHILGEWVRAFPITARSGFVPFPKGLNIEQYAYKVVFPFLSSLPFIHFISNINIFL